MALGRTGLGIEGYEDFIQTDASINPEFGRRTCQPQRARDIMHQLIAHGEIKRAQLGVTIQDLTPDLAKTSRLNVEMGAVVNEVIAGSPAEKAGIQAGNVVTEVNGLPISGASSLRNKIGPMPIGSELHITLIRNGASKRNCGSDVLEAFVRLRYTSGQRLYLQGITR